MTHKPLVLVIEDEKPIRSFLRISMEANGYRYAESQYGGMAVSLAASHNPDVIILDLGLPDLDGMEVLYQLRPMTKAAIIVLSARGREEQKVEALDCGADDYLTKPFSVAELMARIRVALRHSHRGVLWGNDCIPVFSVGDLRIDLDKRRVFLAEREIHLTPMEYKLMSLMAKHAGRVLTHHYILTEVWGAYLGNDSKSLRVFMANIRRKLEHDPAQPRYILTEIGVGYRLAEE